MVSDGENRTAFNAMDIKVRPAHTRLEATASVL
jgi:hypothetical protein